MNLVYPYDKKRSRCGKQPMFCMTQTDLLDSINPDKSEQRLYCLRNPVNQECQVYAPKGEHEANTITVEHKSRGINHCEGGWPKEIHYNNEDDTLRYRRRIEREDSYVNAIMKLAPKFDYFIQQNNAVEIYEQYFKGMDETLAFEKPTVKLNNEYRDPDKRPISSVCWTHEDDPKLVATYCSKRYPVAGPVNDNFTCHVWALENPHYPASEFLPPTACWVIACSPINPAIIVGGLDDGRVCVFDLRDQPEPIAISPPHVAHRDPVNSLLFIQSRLNNEFFSGSSDGQCMWYDIRNLSKPIDSLIMSVNLPHGQIATFSNSESISALQFDRSFPTRFLCGTDTGLVINVNRKGKTPRDVMSAVFKAHKGPVRAVHRSPCTSKMFITCGDWTTHIWSDDLRHSPIITGMPHRYEILDVVWAPQRLSAYMTVAADGKFRYWDLLRRFRKPVISIPVSRYPLLELVPHEEGRLVAMGGKLGTLFLVTLSEDLVFSGNKDKQLMIQNYERECKREHILETRVKEIRLKKKADDEAASTQTDDVYNEEAQLLAVEEDYRKQVIEEFRRAGIPQTTPINRPDTMRNR